MMRMLLITLLCVNVAHVAFASVSSSAATAAAAAAEDKVTKETHNDPTLQAKKAIDDGDQDALRAALKNGANALDAFFKAIWEVSDDQGFELALICAEYGLDLTHIGTMDDGKMIISLFIDRYHRLDKDKKQKYSQQYDTIMARFLSHPAVDLDRPDGANETLLDIAVAYRNWTLFYQLLFLGAKPDTVHSETFDQCQDREAVEKMLKQAAQKDFSFIPEKEIVACESLATRRRMMSIGRLIVNIHSREPQTSAEATTNHESTPDPSLTAALVAAAQQSSSSSSSSASNSQSKTKKDARDALDIQAEDAIKQKDTEKLRAALKNGADAFKAFSRVCHRFRTPEYFEFALICAEYGLDLMNKEHKFCNGETTLTQFVYNYNDIPDIKKKQEYYEQYKAIMALFTSHPNVDLDEMDGASNTFLDLAIDYQDWKLFHQLLFLGAKSVRLYARRNDPIEEMRIEEMLEKAARQDFSFIPKEEIASCRSLAMRRRAMSQCSFKVKNMFIDRMHKQAGIKTVKYAVARLPQEALLPQKSFEWPQRSAQALPRENKRKFSDEDELPSQKKAKVEVQESEKSKQEGQPPLSAAAALVAAAQQRANSSNSNSSSNSSSSN